MSEPSTSEVLRGKHVMIVEDELLIGLELEDILDGAGCIIVGPLPSVGHALAALETERVDAALLDINLNGQRVTPVAAAMAVRGLPFVLVTGYSALQTGEPELREAPRVDKPIQSRLLLRTLAEALSAAG